VERAAGYWKTRPEAQLLKQLFWTNIALTVEYIQRTQVCSHRSFMGEMLCNDGLRELLFRSESVLACEFKKFSDNKLRFDFCEFIHMVTHLGLYPNIPNDASNNFLLTHVYLRSQQGVRCGLRHECVYEGKSNVCCLCLRKRGTLMSKAVLKLKGLFANNSKALNRKRGGNIASSPREAAPDALIKCGDMAKLVGLSNIDSHPQCPSTPDASDAMDAYMDLHVAQKVLLEWCKNNKKIGHHLAMRLPAMTCSRKSFEYVTWGEFLEAIQPGLQLGHHIEMSTLSLSEFIFSILMVAQLQQDHIEHGFPNHAAIKLLQMLMRFRRSSYFVVHDWTQLTLYQRGLESVRKALHDQLYPIFRHYSSLSTAFPHTQKKLCLETYFLFVNDISLYPTLGYVDFAWIMTTKMRTSLTDELSLFQFLLLNEECVAEDYKITEELRAIQQNTLAETSEAGLCEHCMQLIDRMRTLFELYQLPSRLANFKQTILRVYTLSNISGRGRAKPRMQGVCVPVGSAAALDLWSGGVVQHNKRKTPWRGRGLSVAELHGLIVDNTLDKQSEAVNTDTETESSSKSRRQLSSSSEKDVNAGCGNSGRTRVAAPHKYLCKQTKSTQESSWYRFLSHAHEKESPVMLYASYHWQTTKVMRYAQSKMKGLAKNYVESARRRPGQMEEKIVDMTGQFTPRLCSTVELHPVRALLKDAHAHAQHDRLYQAVVLSEKALRLVSIMHDDMLLPVVLITLIDLAIVQKHWVAAARYGHIRLSFLSRDNTRRGILTQVRALNQLGNMHTESKALAKAVECHARQAKLAQVVGDYAGEMLSCYSRGRALEALRLVDDANMQFKHMEELSYDTDSPSGAVAALSAQAALHYGNRNFELARSILKKKLVLLKQQTSLDPSHRLLVAEVSSLEFLAEISRRLQEHSTMFAALRRQITASRRLGSLNSEGSVYRALGQAILAVHLQVDLSFNPEFYLHWPGSVEETNLLVQTWIFKKANLSPYIFPFPMDRAQSLRRSPKPMQAVCSEARHFLECGCKIARLVYSVQHTVKALENIAVAYLVENRLNEAEDNLIISLSMNEKNGGLLDVAHSLSKLGLLELRKAFSRAKTFRWTKSAAKAVSYMNDQLQIHEHLHRALVTGMMDSFDKKTPIRFELFILQSKATAYSFLAAAHHLDGHHSKAIVTHKAQLESATVSQDIRAIAAAHVSLGFVLRTALEKDIYNTGFRDGAVHHYSAPCLRQS